MIDVYNKVVGPRGSSVQEGVVGKQRYGDGGDDGGGAELIGFKKGWKGIKQAT